MKNIIINIDDLGLANPINQAVINLAEKKRITATSYMVGGFIDDEHKQALDELNIDIGLHLDFTGIFSSKLTGSLKTILFKSYVRCLNKQQVIDNIKQQFDDFEDIFGRTPVFVDGHQHVHQFPIIRDCLMAEILNRADKQHPIASRTTTPLIKDFKAWVIYTLGGRNWQAMCQNNNIVTNSKFLGVYGFDASHQELKQLWQLWLQSCPNSNQALNNNSMTSLIMCHPAVPANMMPNQYDWDDEIKSAREIEYHWLMSEEFENLLEENQVILSSWQAMNQNRINETQSI